MFFSLCSSTQDEQKPPHPRHMLIQRVPVYTQALPHLFADLCVGLVRLVIRGEVHVVDRVRKVVAVAVVLQVRHELVKPRLRRLEGASGRELDVPDDLVHPQDTGNVATFRRLLLDVFGPVFLNALRRHTTPTPLRILLYATTRRDGEREIRAPAGCPRECRNSTPSACTTRGRRRTNCSIRSREALRHSTSRNSRARFSRPSCRCRCGARRSASPGQPFLRP